jgi:hypothetical protein
MLGARSNSMFEMTQFNPFKRYCYRATARSSSWERNNFNTPAIPVAVLKKPAEERKVLGGKDQTNLRSGIGKLMYHMQYLRPDIPQAVRDLARHMTRGDETHIAAILRCMQYLMCTKDAGLLLKLIRKWDGTGKFQIKVRGRSDSNYAKDTQTRRSVSGYVI